MLTFALIVVDLVCLLYKYSLKPEQRGFVTSLVFEPFAPLKPLSWSSLGLIPVRTDERDY